MVEALVDAVRGAEAETSREASEEPAVDGGRRVVEATVEPVPEEEPVPPTVERRYEAGQNKKLSKCFFFRVARSFWDFTLL